MSSGSHEFLGTVACATMCTSSLRSGIPISETVLVSGYSNQSLLSACMDCTKSTPMGALTLYEQVCTKD